MPDQAQKKKPTKLQWEGGLLNTTNEGVVLVKNKVTPPVQKISTPKKIIGGVSIRTEKKGRAGCPVSILFKFSDPEARNKESLKQLCSELKTKFACGGTVENGEIILMIRDIEKLKSVLISHFGFKF